MKVLVLGSTGMLGHQLVRILRDRFEVRGLSRADGLDAERFETVEAALDRETPDAVVNAVGVVKQKVGADSDIACIRINSLLPRLLAKACAARGARLIHISTDCVFSGKKGNYTEDDPSDAEDLYGRTKFLGEIGAPHLTLRTSFTGPELRGSFGLLEWFLAQTGTVKGYTGAVWTGFTSFALARLIGDILEKHPDLAGVYQLSSEPITKYDLLVRLKKAFGLDVTVEPYDDFKCDRSMDSTRLRDATGLRIPTWDEMIEELEKEMRHRHEQAVAG